MEGYQLDYSANRSQMYDLKSRIKKAERIVKLLGYFLGSDKLKNLNLLDIGSSTGIIDNYLAKHFKKVLGIDIDEKAIKFANKNFKAVNLTFKREDAMKVDIESNSFDVIICTHVYEHVPDANKIFPEIYRILKPNGVCYFAAVNKYWPIEPHYNLLFLSWLPKKIADIYVRLLNKSKKYYEKPRSYWDLKKLTNKFKVLDFTVKVIENPKQFGFDDTIPNSRVIKVLIKLFALPLKYASPTFFWLLIKED